MRFFRKSGKLVLSTLLTIELLSISAVPASAGLFGGGVSIPSPSKVAGELENRYHINRESMQSMGENLNVSGDKGMVPEVSLYFTPNDPKEGQKLSAKAFPMYFSNTEESLYYSWYLFRKDCDSDTCDYDGDGRYDEEDWKIEAARIMAENGFDPESNPSGEEDDDGYRARHGGDSKTNVPDHCYIHDTPTGGNYELVESLSGLSNACQDGYVPVCLVGEGVITPDTTSAPDITDPTTTNGTAFDTDDTNQCYVSGTPTCSSGTLTCSSGTPSCISQSTSTVAISCISLPWINTACTTNTRTSADPYCPHLFPNAPDATTGDGLFYTKEEHFWGTDPTDPSTANNGNKDEANVAGLGQSTFTWNYIAGDMVGVAVEGTSMITTKHDDSSAMIMWAFPKKDCSALDLVEHTNGAKAGEYVESVKGYQVKIPAISGIDLNDCIEKNLVDPTKSVTDSNLEVSIEAVPDNPINDGNGKGAGDTVSAQASISNGSRGLANTLFDWDVYLSGSPRFDPAGTGVNKVVKATETLRSMGLLGNTSGNALDAISVKLNIPNGMLSSAEMFGGSVPDPLYMRFSVKASESVSSGISRKGRSDAIVKFTSTDKTMDAYIVGSISSDGRVEIPGGAPICSGTNNNLERRLCRVIKNEIIGLRVDSGGDNLDNFQWTINGVPLVCSKNVSAECSSVRQGNVNFFPVTGDPGDTYTVTVVASSSSTGKTMTLSRVFNVVEPKVTIVPANENVWPKLLGQYRDIAGSAGDNCPGGLCNDYSETISQAFADGAVAMKAQFIPSFLGQRAERAWGIDGNPKSENSGVPGTISFIANKQAGSVINVSLDAYYEQSADVRKALYNIWNVSPLDSPEFRFSASNQIELQDPDVTADGTHGKQKFLAAIASYLPASAIFAFRMLLSAALILFTAGFLFALIPENGFRRHD